jgi:hypothetical protein
VHHDGDPVLEKAIVGRDSQSSLFRWNGPICRFCVVGKNLFFIPTAAQSFDELKGGAQGLVRQLGARPFRCGVLRLGYSPHGQGGSHAQNCSIMTVT